MPVRTRKFSGSLETKVSEREIKNQMLSRKAATEGAVLLKNNGVLPISTDKKIALFGNGISRIIKGGTGSGDVNSRHVISVLEGVMAAGYEVTNLADVKRHMDEYNAAEADWQARVREGIAKAGGSDMSFLSVPSATKKKEIADLVINQAEVEAADAVIYVVSRIAGEGKDRTVTEGDYYLTDKENAQLAEIAKYNSNIVIVINTGAQIDLKEWSENAAAILYVSQPGMEAGHVIADMISGSVTPSGKLTTTWGKNYSDFPNAATFSHCNGDTDHEEYHEGIYVGYRYFDSFEVEPLYPFGFGLSYTSFKTDSLAVAVSDGKVKVTAKVTNTGDVYSGKQVVQVYAACPANGNNKELKRLIGFAKTELLAPGQAQTVEITADSKMLASYNYDEAAWVVDAGEYAVFVGENAKSIELAGVLKVSKDVVIEKVSHILPLEKELDEIVAKTEVIDAFTKSWKAKAEGMEPIEFIPEAVKLENHVERIYLDKAKEIASKMEDDELIAMLMGEITKGQDNVIENELVKTGIYVPGAAGETSCRFEEKYGIPGVSMADGPAGLRLITEYDVDNESKLIYGVGLFAAICGSAFLNKYDRQNVTTYHMFATAIPIGTMLAQTWDTALVEEIGQMIAQEMCEFGVSWWLAPGMNIHRNPLCGRNFEYYSEDPVVAGRIAAAMTRGVQKTPGVGTTIKHFAVNNQEDNRLFSNSILSERTLREIYLRGFEIAVKESQPMCLMTSYNLINGVPAANNTDLITNVLRGEWDFGGIVMSDWTTTNCGSADAFMCPVAGNDLIMPGSYSDVDNMKQAIKDGKLSRAAMEACATRLISLLLEINEA